MTLPGRFSGDFGAIEVQCSQGSFVRQVIGHVCPFHMLNIGTAEAFHPVCEPAIDHRFRFNSRVITPLNPELLLLKLTVARNGLD